MPSCPAALVFIPHFPRRCFTYIVPGTLRDRVCAGMLVRVPFGSGMQIGLVTELIETAVTDRLKMIEDVVEPSFRLSPEMLSLARWMAWYYFAPLGACLSLMLPPAFRTGIRERFIITPLGRSVADETRHRVGSGVQHTVLTTLQSARHGLSSRSIRRRLGNRGITQALAILKNNGYIDARLDVPSPVGNVRRGRRARSAPADMARFVSQAAGGDARLHGPLVSAMQRKRRRTFVLQAAGPDRIRLYLEAIRETMRQGKDAIVLFPHASHARAFDDAIFACVGGGMSASFGSRVPSRRSSEWYRLHAGRTSLVVGSQSSVFSVVGALGLIIVDEEHDSRHKVDQEPGFHTREVALARAAREGATVLLGSLHPSVEAMYLTQSNDAVLFGEHSERDSERVPCVRSRASVHCVDMRGVPSMGRVLSERLVHAMRDRLSSRQRVVLYQPRRGFSRALWCRDCGTTLRCTGCSVALTYYKRTHTVVCHLCGESHDAPHRCFRCSGTRVLPMGFGTERVEEEARTIFPDAHIVRMDRDAIRSNAAVLSFMDRLDSMDLDILIGTSMLLDIVPMLRRVSLIGVLSADTMLYVPDFRAAERAFHHLMALKALLADGEMLIQALQVEHPMLQSVARHDLHQFYADELAMRRELAFPPYTRLICLRVAGADDAVVHAVAARWAGDLRASHAEGIREVLGPIPAPYSKIHGRYRDHIVVKASGSGLANEMAHGAVESSLKRTEKAQGASRLLFEVDVDPYTFL